MHILKKIFFLSSIVQSIIGSDTNILNAITHTFVIGVYCDPALSSLHFGDELFQDFCQQLFTVQQALIVVKEYEIGGIIFLGKSTYAAQKEAMDQLNKASKIPLLYMQDFECGLGMRLIDVEKFPYACTLENEISQYIESYADAIACQMKQLGVHINLAPVCDVRYEDNNITRLRAFSSDPNIVANHAIAYMNGLRKNNIGACAKHFPGHGPTAADSHYDLPMVTKTVTELESHDLIPFYRLIDNNIALIMTGHLLVADGDKTYPASLSRFWIHEYLRVTLGYTGVIITDALNMKSLDSWPAGQKELLALQAGNDMLLCPSKDIKNCVEYIQAALKNNVLLRQELYKKCERISTLTSLLHEKNII